MNVGILGRTELLYNTALRILGTDHRIVFIGTCQAAPEYKIKERDFESLAADINIPYFNSLKLGNYFDVMRSSGAEVCISVNWINIIGSDIIDIFKYGILNAHGGDLPRYRGNACFNWALINGESRVCMTIHKMEPGKLDSGDIMLKKYRNINIKTTIGQLYEWSNECVPEMFINVLDGIQSNQIVPVSQSALKVPPLRCYPRKPEYSQISWDMDVYDIERLVNASSEPFNGAFAFYNDKKTIIWKGYAQNLNEQSLYVNGQILRIDKVRGTIMVGGKNGAFVIEEISYPGFEGKIRPDVIIKSIRGRLM